MPVGPRELFYNALTTAGFSGPEAAALLGQWRPHVRGLFLQLLDSIAHGVMMEVENQGAEITSQTLMRQIKRAKRPFR